MLFESLFEKATRLRPYPYQSRLAAAEPLPEILVAPTGAGKTAAAVLTWLYRRREAAQAVRRSTPRRLVFCLPMRTLVQQTADSARTWLRNLDLLDENPKLARGEGVSVVVLLGGDVDDDWYLHPERDAIIIGTQDMLLSRALNRGYASSRFHWSWDFALLSNDCLWVFDEVQLMGVGLTTGIQLAGLRQALGTFGPAQSLFMSATLDTRWFMTVDHPETGNVLGLAEDDHATPALLRRQRAAKRLTRVDPSETEARSKFLAQVVRDRHTSGTRTLVVLNTVDRATELFQLLRKTSGLETVLLHSRFRQSDRDAALTRALAPDFDGVVISTQVVEAGVDMTSRTLITDLAPWSSLVQRAGRCNRGGELAEADILWLDAEVDEKSALPYEPEDLNASRVHLQKLESFNPEAIAGARATLLPPRPSHILRRRDLEDLFDTTPDLAGYDLDVSRFIRDGEERDLAVFWRVTKTPPPWEPRPARDELCAVPFLRFRDWLNKRGTDRVWRWNHLSRAWEQASSSRAVPGATFLLASDAGGYDSTLGWDPLSTALVPSLLESLPDRRPAEDGNDDDRDSEIDRWVTLRDHSLDAKQAATEIVRALGGDELPHNAIIRAAHAHDLGKGHAVFQGTMHLLGGATDEMWAKSDGRTRKYHSRRGFRHELASALAWLSHDRSTERDLIAYLLAAHHGKVRLSIRSLPEDAPHAEPGERHARGVWEGDEIPAGDRLTMDLGDGLVISKTRLSLAVMDLGGSAAEPSWSSRIVALRNRFGPFRLAFLESLVRAADVRATLREKQVP